jgi:hypothetical protein
MATFKIAPRILPMAPDQRSRFTFIVETQDLRANLARSGRSGTAIPDALGYYVHVAIYSSDSTVRMDFDGPLDTLATCTRNVTLIQQALSTVPVADRNTPDAMASVCLDIGLIARGVKGDPNGSRAYQAGQLEAFKCSPANVFTTAAATTRAKPAPTAPGLTDTDVDDELNV